jgi:hypothetical protein
MWPGQVFGDPALSFEAAMQQCVQATQDRFVHQRIPSQPVIAEPNRRRKEAEGRVQRHQLLEQRKREDRVWRSAKAAFSQVKREHQKLRKAQRKLQRMSGSKSWPLGSNGASSDVPSIRLASWRMRSGISATRPCRREVTQTRLNEIGWRCWSSPTTAPVAVWDYPYFAAERV